MAESQTLPAAPSCENVICENDNAVTKGEGTTTRPPLAPIDGNANCQRSSLPRLSSSERVWKAALTVTNRELLESIVGRVQLLKSNSSKKI